MPVLEQADDVTFILRLGDGENRFTPDWIAACNHALDRLEAVEAPRALITVADGTFWSTGLDLDWIGANPARLDELVIATHRLFARVLSLPVVTVAAIQGHAFAAGAMLALAHDFRVMREDRGFFCLPEVDLHLPFTPGMNALITARLPGAAAHEAMISGRRYGGEQAARVGLVTRATAQDAVLSSARDLADDMGRKDGRTLGAIKTRLFAQTLDALADDSLNTP
ncbi:enoyl-CoA hydratase-related protein [Streptomyces tirandamycinicus]|uniref:Enoyl-CoA hydratase n=1 Tax=Streptomyces tirandamycinicus TaxID=2174846 RepID=A0A2S1SLV6_9ACTN|nr:MULTISPECIES: enoyl-CoA hydratase-related protein [Streptomyces]AWI27405.1 enoyl-CoA hydratase [Streptomyces tirandamycinicus]MCY0984514.1 enoyl-CoA hydratase-related protein [Streptomyces tirandamycinicus]NNJ04892.1 enoyl-CoA hydratase/isomerase family protein [Streptomyces sp. PKU-MA01144]